MVSDVRLAVLYRQCTVFKDKKLSWATCIELIDEIRRLRELNAGLAPLAKMGFEAITECAWQGCNFDGEDIQESAVQSGAIQEVAGGYDPAIHSDSGTRPYLCEPGDRWFEFTPAVLAAKKSLEKA